MKSNPHKIEVEVVPNWEPMIDFLRNVGQAFDRMAAELEKVAKPGAIQSLPEVKTPARSSVDWDREELQRRLFWPEDKADGT